MKIIILKFLVFSFLFFSLGCWPFDPRDSQKPSGKLIVLDTPVKLKNHFVESFKKRDHIMYGQTLHDNFVFYTHEFSSDNIWDKTADVGYIERLFNNHIFTDINIKSDTILIFTFYGGFADISPLDTMEYRNVYYTITSNLQTHDTIRGYADIIIKFTDNSWKIKSWRDTPVGDISNNTSLAYLKMTGFLR